MKRYNNPGMLKDNRVKRLMREEFNAVMKHMKINYDKEEQAYFEMLSQEEDRLNEDGTIEVTIQ